MKLFTLYITTGKRDVVYSPTQEDIIRGNDEKDYPFLVKGGEDLRQDQRIEQLFDNHEPGDGWGRELQTEETHLRTYQVIPMTPR